jgi:diguanylate cyclase
LKYHDSAATSSKYLGSVLALMAKQAAAMNPVSFAVWYEYVAGGNPSLNAVIDHYVCNDQVLDDAMISNIFNRHIAGIDDQIEQRFSESLQKVMSEIATSAAQAGHQAGQFGGALEKWCDEWKSSNPGNHHVETIVGLTRNMQSSITALQDRLAESRHEIDQLHQDVGKARDEAQIDGLTGLTNRRGFDTIIAACLSASTVKLCGPCLIMADIDHFKAFNDTYGHVFGDKVIRAVGTIMKSNVKGKDTAARYGGEEFVVLLPETPIEGARHLAEAIRTDIEKIRIKRSTSVDDWAPARISISLGIAGFRTGESASNFVARADGALYASKTAGRNRVSVAHA